MSLSASLLAEGGLGCSSSLPGAEASVSTQASVGVHSDVGVRGRCSSSRRPGRIAPVLAAVLLLAVVVAVLLLLGTFLAWRPLGPPSAASGLDDAPHYTHVQYLGLNLFTVPGTTADGCFGNSPEDLSSCYLGSPTVEEDIERRAEIMAEAIERIFASQEWDRSPRVLKVFLAPEFYWRGARGAYRLTNPTLANVSSSLMAAVVDRLGHERFRHWLFVLGTVVSAQRAEARGNETVGLPFENFSYYNFAPIHVGGSSRMLVHFKHFISGIDFLQTRPARPRAQPVQPPPGRSRAFCRQHPESSGCVYQQLSRELLERFGFGRHEVLTDGVFEVGGLNVGIEICLDHAVGELCNALEPGQTVDLQIIVSAGMNVASGPVCTPAGGPVLLSDGFARTELNQNQYGRGRESVVTPNGHSRRFNVGVVYGADALVGLQQWMADAIEGLTGTGFGSRLPGQATLPGGGASQGSTGVPFKQVSALGDDWLQQLTGFYNVASYLEAQRIDRTLTRALDELLRREHRSLRGGRVHRAALYPTVDVYGPLPVRVASGSAPL